MERCNSCQHWRPDGQKIIGTCSVWSSIHTRDGNVVYTEPFECGGNFGCMAHAERPKFHVPSFEFAIGGCV